MTKKSLFFGWWALSLTGMALNLEAADPSSSKTFTQRPSPANRTQEMDDILKEDQIDDTDIYAIPYDDSEVEDQEELDQLEGKKFVPEAPYRQDQRQK